MHKKQKQAEKQKADIKKALNKQQKDEEKQKIAVQRQKAKKKKQLEKQHKIEEQQKREARERRIQERKKQKDEDEFEYEANTAIKMTMKNNQRRKQQEKLDRQQKEQQKRRKRAKRLITSTALILVVIGGSTFAMVSPIFNIQEIQVLNNEQVTQERIQSLSGINKDSNIFRFLKANVIKSIKQEAYIEDAQVKRILPNTVQIVVKERTKKFSIEFLNSYAIINSQGYILEMSQNSESLPIVKGITTPEEQMSAGNRLNVEDLNKIETAIRIMDIFRDNNLDKQVSTIDLSNENECNVEMESEQKTVHLGDSTNLSNKIIYVQAIINETKGAIGEIFVNGDLNNKFKPYFREKIQ